MMQITALNRKFINRIQRTLLTLCLIFTSSCGFTLQGSYSIPEPLSTVHLTSPDKYSELTRLVSERLRLQGIQIVEAAEDVSTIAIIKDTLDRSTLSLYPTGNVAEYELSYNVTFAVVLPQQEPREFVINIHRDYLDDPRTALAKNREMKLLLKEMRIQAADRLIQTLASIEG